MSIGDFREATVTVISIFACLANVGQPLKKKNYPHKSKFFSSRVNPLWTSYVLQGNRKEITKYIVGNIEVYLYIHVLTY